jgi:hypothetical protein
MERMKSMSILFTLAAMAVVCAPSSGQTVRNISPSAPTEKSIPDHPRPLPFLIDGKDSGRADAVEFRTADQMSATDREVAANSQSAIAERAQYAGLEFNQGKWTYEQIVCAALPEHIFLRFMRNNGTGDVSLFTASIPRGTEGRVRIIPIQLRGYSLFSPAPVNAITVSAFNHIRGEENPAHAAVSSWLGTGLCYAALAGGHPQLPSIGEDQAHLEVLADDKGLLHSGAGVGAVISFDDVSKVSRPVRWTMTFDSKGRLLKAARSKAELLKVNAVRPAALDQAGRIVPANQPPQQTKAVPPAPNAAVLHPVPPAAAVPRANPIP